MANTEDELQLDLESALPEEKKEGKIITLDDKGGEVATSETKNAQPSPEDTIVEMRKEMEASRQRELAAVERANRLETERASEVKKATSAIDEAFKSRESSLETAINAAETDLKSIKSQLRAAREKGDIEVEIDLEEKLADVKYNQNALKWEKNNIAGEKTRREELAKQQITQPTERQYTSTEKSWIDSHPRYNSDDEYQAYVWSVDSLAKRKGIQPDTPAYYEFLNAKVDKMFPDKMFPDKERTEEDIPPERKPTPASSTAAPPSRSGEAVARSGQNGRQIRLSADELEAAEFMGMTPAEYAKEKYEIEQQKKVGRA